ncbi:MAG TPA: glycoside hydrolase family 140 protein [Paludibaculum sp.]|jgi:hypothetical protein
MMRTFIFLFVAVSLMAAKPLPKLKVSDNQRFIVTADGQPFFYLADTAWELFHRLDRAQAAHYLDVRAAQGYTAIQAVALAELDGVNEPNAYGKSPLIARDPARPEVTPRGSSYWDHVDYIVDQANARGLYIAMLPTWGSAVSDKGSTLFTAANAQVYGEFIGKRYRDKGIIWILGGDRTPTGVEPVWRAMAKGIAIGVSGKEDYSAVLMSFHPRGGQTSSTQFHGDEWLDFNMQQNGHGIPGKAAPWARMTKDYDLTPVKPAIDGEPLYEDHPLGFNAKLNGYSFDAHVRQYAWWDVFSGGAGHTYGNHSVWQMFAPGRKPINGPLLYWDQAMLRPGAAQMQHLRFLMESRPYLSRVPDQSLVVDALVDADHIAATRGDGYAMIYSGQGRKFTVNLPKLPAKLKGWWYNPRTGSSHAAGEYGNAAPREFVCPSEGFGSDWTLVLDDASRNFPAPGQRARR